MQAIGGRFEDPGDRIQHLLELLIGEAKMHGKDGEHPLGDIGQLKRKHSRRSMKWSTRHAG
jgi:hypothetical protein